MRVLKLWVVRAGMQGRQVEVVMLGREGKVVMLVSHQRWRNKNRNRWRKRGRGHSPPWYNHPCWI